MTRLLAVALSVLLSAASALASAEAAVGRKPMRPDTILYGAAYYHE